MAESIRFKFQFVNENGDQTGFLSKKGSFDGEDIALAKQTIPITAVGMAHLRSSRLILLVAGEDGKPAMLVIAITGGNAKSLHSAINAIASERHARRHLEKLQEKGRAHEFRIEACPHCQSTIDLSGFPESPQAYCMFCNTVATLDGRAPVDERKCHQCDQCELYAQPKQFTIFYFYFLIVVIGWRYQQKQMCNTCMRSEAWKMLFGNLLFILGVPMAITQLVRAYFGGSALSQAYAGLDKANALLKRGKYDRAAEAYDQIAERLGVAAGVRLNHGMAMIPLKRYEDAALQFELALTDCANYMPAAEALAGCYQALERPEDLELLKAQFEDDEAEPEDLPDE